ncbi:MAG: phosphotransferase [Bacteroidales bacterium]|jgi:RNase adaptor protein for sRNA GlmZ degradation|nr:phosphotransferase [Bacteroidales bacterium]
MIETNIRRLFQQYFGENILEIIPLSAHGSARKYYRLLGKSCKCLATYNDNRKENEAFLSYEKQLLNHKINVPRIYISDLDNNIYLQQDLGDITLYDLTAKNNYNSFPFDFYRKVITCLPDIQMTGKDFDYTFAYPRKAFDRQSIDWDLQYFKYYFLKMTHISFNEQELEKDFNLLADYLLTAKRDFFMYRDFQSRNIMIYNDEPYFIDFQGGRQGALQYDIASLLFDAKANISSDVREELLEYYIAELTKHIDVDKIQFGKLFYAFVYVRIMQAMGSYGYRGYFERKSHFLASIPYAVRNLKWLEENVSLPVDLTELKRVFEKVIEWEATNARENNNLHTVNNAKDSSKLTLTIKSFSYKKGYPKDESNGGGFVFDCRALHNPGRYDEYKHLTGKDKEVIDFLEKEDGVKCFYDNVFSIVKQSCYEYIRRQFTNLSVNFGCTGGQHRSVYMAERLAKDIVKLYDLNVVLQHLEEK